MPSAMADVEPDIEPSYRAAYLDDRCQLAVGRHALHLSSDACADVRPDNCVDMRLGTSSSGQCRTARAGPTPSRNRHPWMRSTSDSWVLRARAHEALYRALHRLSPTACPSRGCVRAGAPNGRLDEGFPNGMRHAKPHLAASKS